MALRLGVLGSFVLVLLACQKDRDDIEPTGSTSGSGITATANGSGGAGGAAGTGNGGASSSGGDGGAGVTGTPAATSTSSGPSAGGAGPTTSSGGEGGDPSSSGGAGPGSGSGGAFPGTCGSDDACWGDEPSPCGFEICDALFVECEPNVASEFAATCGRLSAIVRPDIWAHIVDCMRDAGVEVGCSDEGVATADACYQQAFDEACPSDEVDALCDDTEVSCAGFDADACKRDAAILGDVNLGDYQGCLDTQIANDGDCATMHNLCFYGTPNP
jgi:hypothetical protein